MDDRDNDHLWHLSRDIWRKGAVTSFLEEQVAGLKDANGNPLPEHAKKFFMDILFLKIKTPRKTRKLLFSEYAVRQVFESRLRFHKFKKFIEADNAAPSETPKDAALASTAEVFGISESAVSEIIYPRLRRQKKIR